MGMIRVNIDAVMAQSHDIENAKRIVQTVKSSVDSLSHQLDPKILARHNISGQIRHVSAQLGDISTKTGNIRLAAENGVSSYYAADREASIRAAEFFRAL